MPRPETAPNRIGRRNSGVSATSSTTSAGPRYSGNQLIAAPRHGSDDQGDPAAQRDCEQRRDDRRTSTQRHARDDRSHGGGRRDQHRLEHQPELRHAEVEFDLVDRHSDQQARRRTDSARIGRRGGLSAPAAPSAGAFASRYRAPSYSSISTANREKLAPPIIIRWVGPHKRHVLAEDAMPDVVEREADHRVHSAGGHQQPADRRVPVAGDAQRCRPRFVERQHHGQHAGHEDAEQADDDEVVRRVGQRTRVAAIADVPADIPDEAEQRADDRRGEHQDGQRDPRRAVELRCPATPRRWSAR